MEDHKGVFVVLVLGTGRRVLGTQGQSLSAPAGQQQSVYVTKTTLPKFKLVLE